MNQNSCLSLAPVEKTNLLLTGISGIGKSTLIHKISTKLSGKKIQGFFSQVILEGNLRKGWRIDTFDGDGGIVAHSDIQSDCRMGRYGVDMSLFERIVSSQLRFSDETDIYLIDEIGIIASWSQSFITAMNKLLDSECRVVAVIRMKENGYIQQTKNRLDVEMWEVTKDNRDNILTGILAWIGD